jgi:PAS domain S-box-containing protein
MPLTQYDIKSRSGEPKSQVHPPGEQMQELRCLYRIWKLADAENLSVEQILQRTVEVIPEAMPQHRGNVGARITVEGRSYQTEHYRPAAPKIAADVFVDGQRGGVLEVTCAQESAASWKEIFTKGERKFIGAVAGHLGRTIQRKRSSEALWVEKANLEALIESAQEAIIMTDNDGIVLRANGEFVRMFGYTLEEVIGRGVDDLVAPQDRHDEASGLTRRVSQSERISIETVRYRKNGTSVEVSILGAPVVVNGEQVGVFGIYRDITDRKKAQQELQKRTQQQSHLLQAARTLTESLDVKEVLTRIAAGAKEIIGTQGCSLYLLESDGATLTPMVAIDPEYEQEVLSTPLDVNSSFTGKAVRARRGLMFNDPLSDPAGKQIPGTPVEADEKIIVAPLIVDEKVLGAMCMDRMKTPFTPEDLALAETFATYASTALKNAQAHDDLHKEVQQRRCTEAKLKDTMDELARSNSELQQFAYVASHDLQEPLRMVASYVQLLSKRYRDKLDQDADEFIDYAVDGATRMQGLINDLLAYSRVGTRGRPFERTDLEEVFDRAVTNLRAAIMESGVRIDHDPLPTVSIDRVQFTQLFQNLIGNAIKFHDRKPPQIRVGAKQRNGKWIFSVRDNGIGIDPEYAQRIFMIFQRLHSRAEYEGSGIGLAICKKIVERHGGRIWVESKPGEGAIFSFTLPIKREDAR